ncbi:MAG TPA: hypothetical protein VLG09_01640 [Candidatus Saccharimonadales bacterium]|nr:hypothetical protein [Candidatus Saccharimonadales bacterium]
MNAKKMTIGALVGLSAGCFSLLYFTDKQTPVSSHNSIVRENCSNGQPAHEDLAKSNNLVLKKIAEYETVCNGAVVDQAMIFIGMPTTDEDLGHSAASVVATLKELATVSIPPLVVFEPDASSPTILRDIHSGKYDPQIDAFFSAIHDAGITDQQMGTWVLFPEANTPSWHTTQPSDFTANVSKVATIQKKYFPSSKSTILLNSISYPDNDMSWSHGAKSSLNPYVKDLPKDLVDSIGLQGFPHQSAANETPASSQLDPKEFLPAGLIDEAAETLGVKTVWLNTGTFKSMYANDASARVSLTPSQRRTILTAVEEEAKELQGYQYEVSVNIFAANKAQASEHVDWSYWSAGKADQSQDTTVIDAFIRQIRADDISFSLYDTAT